MTDQTVGGYLSAQPKVKPKANSFAQAGGWLPSDPKTLSLWVADLIKEVEADQEKTLHPVIQEFKTLIETNPVVYMYITKMITQVPKKYEHNPVGGPQIKSYQQMLCLINAVLTKAPEFNDTSLVGFPINAILEWSMGTQAGFWAFLNDDINAMFKKILNVWCEYLSSEDSLYVLNRENNGWMCKAAQKAVQIEEYQHSPDEPFWGFKSWNDFFTREFKPGKRPVAEPDNDKVIVSACESTPYAIRTDVQKHSTFWIKSQPYSLEFILANEFVDQFVGGTIYQAFLSAINYHRWHSPVSGTIKKCFVKQGSYYSETLAEGFDPAGPDRSQGYITQVATRAIIFIESDDPVIGLMCVIPVGMSEVSSCVIKNKDGKDLKPGDKVKKGEQLGYFQFGGSTHCLIFRKDVISEFSLNAIPAYDTDCHDKDCTRRRVVKVNSKIAVAR